MVSQPTIRIGSQTDTLNHQPGSIDPSLLSIQSLSISRKREDHNVGSDNVQKMTKSVQSQLDLLLQGKLFVLVQIIEVTCASVIFWITGVKHRGLRGFRLPHQFKWFSVSLQETDHLQPTHHFINLQCPFCTWSNRDAKSLTDLMLGRKFELWWMHIDATARVSAISSGSYPASREGSTSPFMLFDSSSGFAFEIIKNKLWAKRVPEVRNCPALCFQCTFT
jgi:hypothetical protein